MIVAIALLLLVGRYYTEFAQHQVLGLTVPRRRHAYDPLADRVRPHWLEICDAHGHVIEYTTHQVTGSANRIKAQKLL